MSTNMYLSLADQGKNAWWRYLVGILLIVVLWIAGSALLIGPVAGGGFEALRTPVGFALSLLSFAPMLLGTWLVTAWIHRRPVGSLIGPSRRLNWRRIVTGMAVWVVLMALATAGEAALFGTYSLNRNFLQNWPFLLLAVALLPIQTSAEEFLFRGYLLQGTGRITKNWILLSVINGALFTVLHLANPEAGQEPVFATLSWFAIGVFFALITLRSGSLDYALGIHAIHNVSSAVLFGYEGGVLPATALFITPQLHGLYTFVSLLVALVVAYWILFQPRKALQAEASARA